MVLAPPSLAFRENLLPNITIEDIRPFSGVGFIQYTNNGRNVYSIATLLSHTDGNLALTNSCEGRGRLFFKDTPPIPVSCYKVGTRNISVAVLNYRAPERISRHQLLNSGRENRSGRRNRMIGFSCDSFGQHVGRENNVFEQMRSATFPHGAQTDVLCQSSSGNRVGSIGRGAPVFDQSGKIVGMGDYFDNSDSSRFTTSDWSDVYSHVSDNLVPIYSFAGIVNMPPRRICYRAYIQGDGWWQPIRCDGQIAGTVGKRKRLEAIQIWSNVSSQYGLSDRSDELFYPPNYSSRGGVAGVVGRRRQSFYFFIRPNQRFGPPNHDSRIMFDVHSDRVGWLGWRHAEFERTAAVTGVQGHYIQAVRIKFVPIGSLQSNDRSIPANQSSNQPNNPEPSSRKKPFVTPIKPTIRQIPRPIIKKFPGL